MRMRENFIFVIILVVLLGATIFDVKPQYSADVFSSARLGSSLIVVPSLDSAQAYKASLVESCRESKNLPIELYYSGKSLTQHLTESLELNRSILSLAMEILLSVAARFDAYFNTVGGVEKIIEAFQKWGLAVFVVNSKNGADKAKIFPGNFYSVCEYAAFQHKAGPVAATYFRTGERLREQKFVFRRLDLSEFPSLPMPFGAEQIADDAIGQASFNGSYLVFNYPTVNGFRWAYCETNAWGALQCGTKLAVFTLVGRRELSRIKKNLLIAKIFLPSATQVRVLGGLEVIRSGRALQDSPLVLDDVSSIWPEGSVAAVNELLQECRIGKLDPRRAIVLHELVLKRGLRFQNFDSTLPSILSACAAKIGDHNLLSHGCFMAGKLIYERGNFLKSSDFFKTITGEKNGWDLKEKNWNWFTDGDRIFSSNLSDRLLRYSESIAGLKRHPSSSFRALRALVLVLVIEQRHSGDSASVFAKNTILGNKNFLLSSEREWVERRIRELSPLE
jgi:hypothetical protein